MKKILKYTPLIFGVSLTSLLTLNSTNSSIIINQNNLLNEEVPTPPPSENQTESRNQSTNTLQDQIIITKPISSNKLFEQKQNLENWTKIDIEQTNSKTNIFNVNQDGNLEFDINKYKPIGLDDDAFLKSVSLDLFGAMHKIGFTNEDNKSNYCSNGAIDGNIVWEPDYNFIKGDNNDDLKPSFPIEENIYNLYVGPSYINIDKKDTTSIKWVNKLVYNFLCNNTNSFKNDYKSPYAYIVFKMAHIIEYQNNNEDDIVSNKLVIQPFLVSNQNDAAKNEAPLPPPPKPEEKYSFARCDLLNKVDMWVNDIGFCDWGPPWSNVPINGGLHWIDPNHPFDLIFNEEGDLELTLANAKKFANSPKRINYFDFIINNNEKIKPSDIFNEIKEKDNKNFEIKWELDETIYNLEQVGVNEFRNYTNKDRIYVDLYRIKKYWDQGKRLNIKLKLTLLNKLTNEEISYESYLKIKDWSAENFLDVKRPPKPPKPDFPVITDDKEYIKSYENGLYFYLPKNYRLFIKLSSDYFSNNQFSSKITANDYLCDQQRFNLYEPNLESKRSNNNKSIYNDYLTIDTSQGIDKFWLGPSSSEGKRINNLLIDTSNFYFDSDENHKKTEFLIKIQGLKVKQFKVIKKHHVNNKIQTSCAYFYPDQENDNNNQSNKSTKNDQTLDINFKLRDEEFDSIRIHDNGQIRFPIYKDINIMSYKQLFDEHNISNLNLRLRISIVPVVTKDANNRYVRVPFKYKIRAIGFFADNYSRYDQNGNLIQYDILFQLASSNNVLVKSTVTDFNYLRMVNMINYLRKDLYTITSSYSSNVFDHHYLVDESGKEIESNYNQVLKIAQRKFNELINTPDFLYAQNAINSTNIPNTKYFNEPFIQTVYEKYNGNQPSYQSRGEMVLRYSPIKINKYFNYIQTNIRVNIDQTAHNGNEIVELDLNNQKLLELSKDFSTMDLFINYLNTSLSTSRKLNLIIFSNKANDLDTISQIVDAQSIKFYQISNQNKIAVKLDLINKFYYYDTNNYRLINKNINLTSKAMEINIFNPNKVTVQADEVKIRKLASTCIDYNDFKNKYQNSIVDLINISNNQAIKRTSFLDSTDPNEIVIKVELIDNYVFNNNERIEELTIGNINWQNQNNEIIPIKIDLNYQVIAQTISNYSSLEQFIINHKNDDINQWANAINYYETNYGKDQRYKTTIQDLKTITFEPINSSFRKVKVTIKANSWRYFEFNGSTISNNKIEFIISNLYFKNEQQTSLTKLNINIDTSYLYDLMKQYYSTNKNASLNDFVNQYRNQFIVYDKNEISIIKIDPYDIRCLTNPPIITTNTNGIKISLDLSDGYYIQVKDDIDYDQFCGTYERFISIDELKNLDEEMNRPDSQKMISNIEGNETKINNDIKLHKNINQFINSLNSDYLISQYLVFENPDDIAKIKKFEIVKTSDSSLDIIITCFNEYYYSGLATNIKTKTISFNNLNFTNQNLQLTSVSVNVNTSNLAKLARTFYDVDELVKAFSNKHTYEDYQEILDINKKHIEAIKNINLIKGDSERSIVIDISLNNGYYFVGESEIKGNKAFQMHNLLFKHDPLPEEALISCDIDFNGNELLKVAQECANFDELKAWLFNEQENNYLKLLNIKFSKENEHNIEAIKYFNIFYSSPNTYIIRIRLNEGYYFKGQDYTNLSKKIIVGNVYFKNETVPELVNIDIKFNAKRFYLLTKDKKFQDWVDFVEYLSPNILNFTDSYNAVLWTNTDNQEAFNYINSQAINNEYVIELNVISGYYFDEENQSNTNLKLAYTKQQLNDLYNEGKDKVDQAHNTYIFIIILSVTIPVIVIALIVIILVIRNKKIQRKIGD